LPEFPLRCGVLGVKFQALLSFLRQFGPRALGVVQGRFGFLAGAVNFRQPALLTGGGAFQVGSITPQRFLASAPQGLDRYLSITQGSHSLRQGPLQGQRVLTFLFERRRRVCEIRGGARPFFSDYCICRTGLRELMMHVQFSGDECLFAFDESRLGVPSGFDDRFTPECHHRALHRFRHARQLCPCLGVQATGQFRPSHFEQPQQRVGRSGSQLGADFFNRRPFAACQQRVGGLVDPILRDPPCHLRLR